MTDKFLEVKSLTVLPIIKLLLDKLRHNTYCIVQLSNNSSIRINHYLYCFKIVTALNLHISFTCAIKGNCLVPAF